MKLGRRWLITIAALSLLPFMFVNLTHAAPLQPGQIFVAYGGNQIGVFADTVSLTGDVIQTLEVPSPGFLTVATLGGGGGLALDEEGNLYATLSDNKGKVGLVKFRASDSRSAFEKTYTISGVKDFRSLVIRDGRIYVATDSGIRVFDATTGDRISAADFGGALAYRDLAFDKYGNLYGLRQTAPGAGNRLVIRRWRAGSYSGDGEVIFSIGDNYANSDPRALVIDEDGNIYVTINSPKGVLKIRPGVEGRSDETSDIGSIVGSYGTPSGTGTLIGLDYDPGTQRLFASHTATGGIGQILWIDRNAASGSIMSVFPNNRPYDLSGVRWLAVYPTPEPATAVFLLAGLGWLVRRIRRKA